MEETIRSFVALDLETTGLDTKKDKIIEIGAVKYQDGVEVDAFSTYVHSPIQVPANILELTGILKEDLDKAPEFQEIKDDFLHFLGDEILLGHRILFDFAHVKRAFALEKIPYERKGIDTLKLCRTYMPEGQSKRLKDVCEYFGIPLENHRALADARGAAEVYFRLCKEYPEVAKIAPTPLQYKIKKETRITLSQIEQIQKLTSRLGITPDYEAEKLTRSEASRIIESYFQKLRSLGETL